MAIQSGEFETIQRRTKGLTFSALAVGLAENPQGPLVICLHGFPDTPRTYRNQLPLLAGAGYRVIAPVLRGYEPSSQPGNRDYSVLSLVDDVLDWVDHLGIEGVHLVGHDWGAAIACAAGSIAPGRFQSLTLIACTNFTRASKVLRNVPRQALLSWYINFFQLRGIAEVALKRPGWPLLRKLWRDWAPGYALPPREWELLIRELEQPGVIDAALSYYRQNASPGVFLGWRKLGLEGKAEVDVRTLVVAGLEDGCFDSRIFEHIYLQEDFPRGLRIEKLAGAGHFPHLERPELFNTLLLEWLAADSIAI